MMASRTSTSLVTDIAEKKRWRIVRTGYGTARGDIVNTLTIRHSAGKNAKKMKNNGNQRR
jgi:ABC-type phosphonate transport system ATPase subunit